MGKQITLADLASKSSSEESQQKSSVTVHTIGENDDKFTPEEQTDIKELIDSIDLTDADTPVLYGSGAQRKSGECSDRALAVTKDQSHAAITSLLNQLLSAMQSIQEEDIPDFDPANPPSLFQSSGRQLRKLQKQYQDTEEYIDQLTQNLEMNRLDLLKEIALLEELYEKNYAAYRRLLVFIDAGEKKFREIKEETIPSLEAEASAKGDAMSQSLVADFRAQAERFEKRIYDLEVSRTITLQAVPQLALLIRNDQVLATKIESVITQTIPLWKSLTSSALGLTAQGNIDKSQTSSELIQRIEDTISIS